MKLAAVRRGRFRRSGGRSSRPRRGGRWLSGFVMPSSGRTSRCWMMRGSGRLGRWRSTASGASGNCRNGWAMGAFEYRQAEEVRDAFARHGCRYLFIGKSGAILLGFPDTTQDAGEYGRGAAAVAGGGLRCREVISGSSLRGAPASARWAGRCPGQGRTRRGRRTRMRRCRWLPGRWRPRRGRGAQA
jgi:hypothetical protein